MYLDHCYGIYEIRLLSDENDIELKISSVRDAYSDIVNARWGNNTWCNFTAFIDVNYERENCHNLNLMRI